MQENGHVIIFEGEDGVGKTTQIGFAEQDMLNDGHRVMRMREPGGTPFAEAIRTTVKDARIPRHPLAEAAIILASRIDQWYERAEPALADGITLLCDRSFESSIIFQGKAGGVDVAILEDMHRLTLPKRYLKPDMLLLFMILDPQVRLERLNSRGVSDIPDAMETRDIHYQQHVREGYLELAQQPHVTIIDSSGSQQEVRALVQDKIKTLY